MGKAGGFRFWPDGRRRPRLRRRRRRHDHGRWTRTTGRVVARIDAKKQALLRRGAGEGEHVIVGTRQGRGRGLRPGRQGEVGRQRGRRGARARRGRRASSAMVRTARRAHLRARRSPTASASGCTSARRRRCCCAARRAWWPRPATSSRAIPAASSIALDLDDGSLTWEVTVSLPRGATELERMADVAGLPVIDGGPRLRGRLPGQGRLLRDPGRQHASGRATCPAPRARARRDATSTSSDDPDTVHALDRAAAPALEAGQAAAPQAHRAGRRRRQGRGGRLAGLPARALDGRRRAHRPASPSTAARSTRWCRPWTACSCRRPGDTLSLVRF